MSLANFNLPNIRQIIRTELTTGLAVNDVSPEEMNDFVDYVLLANCGATPFYLPDERIAVELEPETNEELRQSLED